MFNSFLQDIATLDLQHAEKWIISLDNPHIAVKDKDKISCVGEKG
ncbi:MAG: hypothetical protein BWY45_03557 [Euryarchaeota archaeon ADurb.Bin294]|nr:MAG: hypothetical protein BWY45_03557 [Euryarchaeota archaeon ADurb.Bin294]